MLVPQRWSHWTVFSISSSLNYSSFNKSWRWFLYSFLIPSQCMWRKLLLLSKIPFFVLHLKKINFCLSDSFFGPEFQIQETGNELCKCPPFWYFMRPAVWDNLSVETESCLCFYHGPRETQPYKRHCTSQNASKPDWMNSGKDWKCIYCQYPYQQA